MLLKISSYDVLALPIVLIIGIVALLTGVEALWNTHLAFITLFIFIGGFFAMGVRYGRVAGKPKTFKRDGVAYGLLFALSLWPLYVYIPLYFMALEAQKIIGS